LIDQDKVAMELGVNLDQEDKEAVASRKEAETNKASLVQALASKLTVLLDLQHASQVNVKVLSERQDEMKLSLGFDVGAAFADASKQLQKWDDMSSDKYWRVIIEKHKQAGR